MNIILTTKVNHMCNPEQHKCKWTMHTTQIFIFVNFKWRFMTNTNVKMKTCWQHNTPQCWWHGISPFEGYKYSCLVAQTPNFEKFGENWLTCTPLSHVSENLLEIVYFQTSWDLPLCRPNFQEFNGKDDTPIQCPTLKIWILKDNSQLIPKWILKLIKFFFFV
jgi:hypothetical protein